MNADEHNKLVHDLHANPFGKMLADQVVKLERENASLKESLKQSQAHNADFARRLYTQEAEYELKYRLAVSYLRRHMKKDRK